MTTTNGTLYAQVWRQVSGAWTLIGQNTFNVAGNYVPHILFELHPNNLAFLFLRQTTCLCAVRVFNLSN